MAAPGAPPAQDVKKMVSGLVLLPWSHFFFFLGFSSPLATSGGSSLTPHLWFTQQRPPDLRVCLIGLSPISISCARCPLPRSQSPWAKSGICGKDRGEGGALPSPLCNSCRPLSSPESCCLSIPSHCVSLSRREKGLRHSHLSLHPSACAGLHRRCRGHAGGPAGKEKARRGGGKKQQPNSNPRTRPPPKKRETLRNVEL